MGQAASSRRPKDKVRRPGRKMMPAGINTALILMCANQLRTFLSAAADLARRAH
jgi:hypothetical protein